MSYTRPRGKTLCALDRLMTRVKKNPGDLGQRALMEEKLFERLEDAWREALDMARWVVLQETPANRDLDLDKVREIARHELGRFCEDGDRLDRELKKAKAA